MLACQHLGAASATIALRQIRRGTCDRVDASNDRRKCRQRLQINRDCQLRRQPAPNTAQRWIRKRFICWNDDATHRQESRRGVTNCVSATARFGPHAANPTIILTRPRAIVATIAAGLRMIRRRPGAVSKCRCLPLVI